MCMIIYTYVVIVSFKILVKGGWKMYGRIVVEGNYQHALHADASGVWGHVPPSPRKFLLWDWIWGHFKVKLLDVLLENFSMVMIVATLLHIKIVIPIIKWNIWVTNQSFVSDTSWCHLLLRILNAIIRRQQPVVINNKEQLYVHLILIIMKLPIMCSYLHSMTSIHWSPRLLPLHVDNKMDI